MSSFRNMRIWRYIDEVAKAGSVRQAAERVNITSSALLRRLQDAEHDLGSPIFERHPSGMRLTAAGELLLRWVRSQQADLQRVMSQISELSGMQRGEVSIACSQATQTFLAHEISAFRKLHPRIKFTVNVTDYRAALQALSNFECDLVLIFQPYMSADVQVIGSVQQNLVAVMAHDHPLAAKSSVTIAECGAGDVAFTSIALGGREALESQLLAACGKLNVAFETNSTAMIPSFLVGSQVVAFHIDIGVIDWKSDSRIAVRPISDMERPSGPINLAQLRGRTLPLAAAKFSEHLKAALMGPEQRPPLRTVARRR